MLLLVPVLLALSGTLLLLVWLARRRARRRRGRVAAAAAPGIPRGGTSEGTSGDGQAQPGLPGVTLRTLDLPGGRQAHLAAPAPAPAPDPHRTATAVLALHGGGGGALRFARGSGLVQAFAAHGLPVTFPEAAGRWADGRPAAEAGWPQDHAFIAALGDLLTGRPGAPLALAGVSNGGMFALRLACALGPRVRAAVAVAAAMPEALAQAAPPGPPVPVLLVQALDDPMIPFAGGAIPELGGLSMGGRVLGAEASAAFWLARNRCAGPVRRQTTTIAGIPAEIAQHAPPPGAPGASVWRVTLQGGGHGWAGRSGMRGGMGGGMADSAEDSTAATLREDSLEGLVARFIVWHLGRAAAGRPPPPTGPAPTGPAPTGDTP